jgi:hypothetical protein
METTMSACVVHRKENRRREPAGCSRISSILKRQDSPILQRLVWIVEDAIYRSANAGRWRPLILVAAFCGLRASSADSSRRYIDDRFSKAGLGL